MFVTPNPMPLRNEENLLANKFINGESFLQGFLVEADVVVGVFRFVERRVFLEVDRTKVFLVGFLGFICVFLLLFGLFNLGALLAAATDFLGNRLVEAFVVVVWLLFREYS